jgi:hypothetical protein
MPTTGERMFVGCSACAATDNRRYMARRRSEKIHGSKCTVCNHPDRAQIDLAIASGLAKKRIAARFGGLSMDAVWRHGKDHLPAEMRAALALRLIRKEGDTRAVLLEEGASSIEAIRALRGPMFARFLAACDCGDDRSAAQLAGRIHEGLSLGARITGEMIPAVGTSVTNIVCRLRPVTRRPAGCTEALPRSSAGGRRCIQADRRARG